MKIVWYAVIGLLLLGSIDILFSHKIYSQGSEVDIGRFPSIVIVLFLLYAVYILWDEKIRN